MKEIERKFLVKADLWVKVANPVDSSFLQQAYLSLDPERSVRVRVTDNKAWLTIKGATEGMVREEFEYPIPIKDALALFKLAATSVLVKRRYKVWQGEQLWEVDEFYGDNEGLILAEAELSDVNDRLELPEWIDREVTHDPAYYNMNLVQQPFSRW